MSIAIVGASVELPGVGSLDDLWRVISTGTSLTRPFPQNRREKLSEYIRYLRATTVEPVDDDGLDFHNGSYLDTVDAFDYAAFGMTPRQAALTDPHHRMVIRAMFLALEDAGYSADRLRGSRTGVFVGFATNPGSTYMDYISRVEPSLSQQAITGNIPAMLANRLSHLLDLRGPSLVVDTACSATLVAVHQAKNALLAGDCDMAVIGGARIVFAPVKHPHSAIGIESSDGVTRTFDEAADGTGFGEGSGAIVLKRTEQALADGDEIYAILKGSAVNHDGHTDGITSPSAQAQSELLLAAWANADIDPRTIGYFEAHGTATRVGDPIEHEGMKLAFARHTADRSFCAVGTVKANVGHLFEGSGVIGLLKALAVLRHRQLPPQANFVNPNPQLDFASGPLFVPTSLQPWESPGQPRRCGVSAFGLGGTNAHVVLEEYVVPERERGPDGTHGPASESLFTLSAATIHSLTGLLRRYLRFIDDGGLDGLDIADVCHTTQVSRSAHRYRIALAVTDAEDLRRGLDAILTDGRQPVVGALAEAADAYLRGAPVDWQRLAAGRTHRIVRLPHYVFDESTAWLDFPQDWRQTMSLDSATEQRPVTHDVELLPAPRPETTRSGTVLALVDPFTEAENLLAPALPADSRIIRLGEPISAGGARFAVDSVASFEHVVRLAEETDVTHLVYALAFEATPATDIEEVERRAAKNLHGLFHLSKALMAAGAKLDLVVLTRTAVSAHEGDSTAVTENAALVGFGKVLVREYPYVQVKHVDVDMSVSGAAIRAEIFAEEYGLSVLRGEQRTREMFVEVPEIELAPVAPGPRPYLRQGGTYLITGGTGALGLAVAHDFASAQPDVTVVLLSRSGLPPRDQWDGLLASTSDSSTAARVRAVLELESLGASVVAVSVDVGDSKALAEAVTRIRHDHGRIDGIVHAAGLPGGSTVIFRQLDDFDAVVRAKLHAAFVLDELTRVDPPDFIVHFSSVASVFPAPGQADYAAANYYLDNLARSQAGGRCHVIALDWVAWKEIGMAVDYGTNGDTMFKALPTSVGLAVLDAGLRSRRSRLFAGELHYGGELIHLLRSYDVALSPEIEASVQQQMHALEERLAKATGKIRASVEAVVVQLDGRQGDEYSATELSVARCLALAFGYDRLDVQADFFDLGGDSLMATTVANHIAVYHDVSYDVADLLADRTAAEIAYHIEDLREFAASSE
ncbi:SDR family NAD(P)-dependent oxidoreductase [Micromonospora sp. NBC_01813]|uniref:SDR family NAD(P)-dependent oxidoreductase n=1 Tax=Micromonospora sp. NBC_01813 TaxID=2975988 RepID=UPI002DDC8B94|nr:SDR family NAD(P)-dependent oxidoreductase [Micromonospora sp. NBC_01813]WSA09119.1 SDR family NAD(P)-dependent oxidoreductase [Micromonospora sp. NBC_01813]